MLDTDIPTVTDNKGVVTTFQSVAEIANAPHNNQSGTGRYLPTSVVDPNGNRVTYAYTCPDLPVCYPARISYDSHAEIVFRYERRPDYEPTANGTTITWTTYRLKTVYYSAAAEAGISGGYVLSYDQAPFSNASRLVQVDRYGRDAALDSSGNIAGGTHKVLRAMVYDNINYNYTRLTNQFPAPTPGDGAKQLSYFLSRQIGDLNFDGKDEFYGSFLTYSYNSALGAYRPDPLQFTAMNFSPQNGAVSQTTGTTVPRANLTYDNLPVPNYFAARYVAGKPKDLAFTYNVTNTGSNDSVTKTRVSGIITTDSSLNLSASLCPEPYSSVCSVIPTNYDSSNTVKNASIDTDGDGKTSFSIWAITSAELRTFSGVAAKAWSGAKTFWPTSMPTEPLGRLRRWASVAIQLRPIAPSRT
ncbi:hypothetical protein HJC06_30510 [Rhizobium sp. NLR9b]|uniref:hypothetical protein n=1 Tax=unclassified Rhizobium TaxID=2613769 RepID=UPI001C838694|nr:MULTISPECIES: hypothetical protein [unclassified Rhizobium]MBX5230661.1 hypothetical protein [Rhizobium sp. NLR9b]MBX5291329.1 hypothetical protein [Rhizobium sp. NLR10b]